MFKLYHNISAFNLESVDLDSSVEDDIMMFHVQQFKLW